MSIRTRLWLFITALIGVVLLGNAFFVFNLETREINEAFGRENMAFATLAGPQALRAYGESQRRDGDSRVSEKLAQMALGLPQLKAMALYGPRGRILVSHPQGMDLPVQESPRAGTEGARHSKIEFRGESMLDISLPVRATPDAPPMIFRILVSEEPVRVRLKSLAFTYGTSLLLLLVLGAFLALHVAKLILKPVDVLKKAARGLKEGDLATRAVVGGTGEISELAAVFNDMAEKLQTHMAELEEKNADLKMAYSELQALYGELGELERAAAVGRTAAAMSHEIDNPLGVILGTAGTLKKENREDPELILDLNLIEEECLRLRRIVRDLLAFSRPAPRGAGGVDLKETTARLLRGLMRHPEMKSLVFTERWPDNSPEAAADEDSVKQVLLNLLLNAGKAMNGEGTVQIEGSFGEGFVNVMVKDTGPGIDPGNLEKIFTPYFTTGGGSGLGLFVSRKLVTDAGGRLTAENREGKGTVFTVSWPVKTANGDRG